MLSNENELSLITLIIQNTKGVLAKVAAFCSENGMNIEKLTLSNFKADNKQQRIVLYVSGNRVRINNLLESFKQIPEVIDVRNFQSNQYLERELFLLKIKENNPHLPKISELVNEYNGSTIFFRNGIIIFQFINEEDKNDELTQRVENLSSDVEILKGGIIATSLNDKMNV